MPRTHRLLRLGVQGDNGAVVEEGQAIAAAQQLVNEAQALSVKVDREVEKLREVRTPHGCGTLWSGPASDS